jgi:transposase
VLQPYNRTVD